MTRTPLLLAAAGLALGAGCAKRSPTLSSAERAPASYYTEREFADDLGGAPGAPPAPPPPPPPAAAEPQEAPPGPASPEPAVQAPQRLVHYEAWTRLRVGDPAEAADRVIALAEVAGGRVETLAGAEVVVRVPVARFREVFAAVLAVGDVLDQTVRADDVTEAFTAVDLRVKLLQQTRDRLVELLAKATEEQEKLQLLRQITQVTEELESFESQRRTLSDLAAMSRIAVSLQPRQAFDGASSDRPLLAGMGWVGALSPFQRAPLADDKRIPVGVPEGFVALSKTGPFLAESPEGAVLWTARVPNDPVGDEAFWIDVLEDRFADEFAAPARVTVGRWTCLDLDQPASDAPYHWRVCASVEGRNLALAQAWFPGPEALARYRAAVDAALAGGAS